MKVGGAMFSVAWGNPWPPPLNDSHVFIIQLMEKSFRFLKGEEIA